MWYIGPSECVLMSSSAVHNAFSVFSADSGCANVTFWPDRVAGEEG